MAGDGRGLPRTLSGSLRDSSLRLASLVVDSSVATVKAVLSRFNRQPLPGSAEARLLGECDEREYDALPACGTDHGDYLDGPSDDPTDQRQRILAAASFVRDAKHGRNPNRRTTRGALRVYWFYHSALGQALRYGSTVAFISIPLYEYPGWCAHVDCDAEASARYWWVTAVWPRALSSCAELLCLALIGCELGARLHFTGRSEFRREWQTCARAAVALLTAADVLAGSVRWLRWRRTGVSRVLRIFVFLAQHHSLRVACMNIFRTLPALTEVLLMLTLMILLSAWAATLLFAHVPQSNFASFPQSLINMYTLSTVTNFPAVTITVFAHSRASFLFFVIFLLVGVLLLMNLTLAIVYEAYRINLGREVLMQQQRQKRALRRAFDSLAVPVDPELLPFAMFGNGGRAVAAATPRAPSREEPPAKPGPPADGARAGTLFGVGGGTAAGGSEHGSTSAACRAHARSSLVGAEPDATLSLIHI